MYTWVGSIWPMTSRVPRSILQIPATKGFAPLNSNGLEDRFTYSAFRRFDDHAADSIFASVAQCSCAQALDECVAFPFVLVILPSPCV